VRQLAPVTLIGRVVLPVAVPICDHTFTADGERYFLISVPTIRVVAGEF
jgi:hypothetical protein